MRTLVLALSLTVALVALPLQRQAQAATEVVVWPAQFSYGTPSGAVTWNTTAFGLRYRTTMVPFVGFGTTIYYGGVSNLALGGTSLSGFSGQTIGGDVSLHFGTSVGRVGVTAYGGYQALALNANGPAATDRVALLTSGIRLGAEARVALSRGLTLRGSVTTLQGLNSYANFTLSSPPTAASFSGTGNGTDYELALSYSLVPFTNTFIGYRAGSYQTNWSGAGSTTTSFNGVLVGLESSF